MSMVSSTEARTPGPAGSAASAPRPSPRSFGTRLWWSPLPVSCVIRELPTQGNGHGESPNQRHCPSMPSLSLRAPWCPSLSDRPLDPRLGGRSPVLPLPSSDAPVRLSHRPSAPVPPPRRAPPCPAALSSVGDPPPGSDPASLPLPGRWLLGKAERSGGRPRRGSRAVPSQYAAQVHRRAGGKFGLAGPICSQQYLRRKNAHDLLLGFPYCWTIWLLLPLQGSLGYTARGRRALLNPPRSPPAPRDPGPRLAPFHLQNTALLEVPYGTVNRLPGSADHRPQIQPGEAQPHPRASVWVTFAEPTEQDRHQPGQPCLGLARQEASQRLLLVDKRQLQDRHHPEGDLLPPPDGPLQKQLGSLNHLAVGERLRRVPPQTPSEDWMPEELPGPHQPHRLPPGARRSGVPPEEPDRALHNKVKPALVLSPAVDGSPRS